MTTAVLLVALPLVAAGLAYWLGWRLRGQREATRRAEANLARATAIAAEERRLREAERGARRVREQIEAKARGGDLRGALDDLGVRVRESAQSGDDATVAAPRVSGPARTDPPPAGDGDDRG